MMETPIIFIVGNARSGTTMMSRILGMHTDVFSFRELHFFQRLWSPQKKEKLLSKEEAVNLVLHLIQIQREGLLLRDKSFIHKYLDEAKNIIATVSGSNLYPYTLHKKFLYYEAKRNGKNIPCEQTPFYVFYIHEILKFYPSAKIINLVRDPRDTLLSQKRKYKRKYYGATNIPVPFQEKLRLWINYHPITMSKLWKAAIYAGNKFSNNTQVFSLLFEELAENPEKNIRILCDFIGIPFCLEMLDVPQVGSSNYADQPHKKGIDKKRTGSWRDGGLDAAEIYLCQKIAGPLMRQYGYGIVNTNVNYFKLFFCLIAFPTKVGIAFIVNLKRIKSISDTIKRRL